MSEDKQIHIDHVRELIKEKGEDVWPGGRSNTANILSEQRHLSEPLDETQTNKRMASMSRRGFLVGGVATAVATFGWRWMPDETKAELVQKAFRFNEQAAQLFYSPKELATEFSPSQVTQVRVNGLEGMGEPIDLDAWRLRVGGLYGRSDDLELTMDDIRRLPRTEMITEFKCIEGWSNVTHWTGVRFADFASAYAPANRDGSRGDISNRPQELPRYVSVTTPDEGYFVGWDIKSILHPQTLLAYEMNGAPLTPEHGAPLRIASPTKYGIKQIKRIGRIEFTDERPRDYWGEQGYDWYSGH